MTAAGRSGRTADSRSDPVFGPELQVVHITDRLSADLVVSSPVEQERPGSGRLGRLWFTGATDSTSPAAHSSFVFTGGTPDRPTDQPAGRPAGPGRTRPTGGPRSECAPRYTYRTVVLYSSANARLRRRPPRGTPPRTGIRAATLPHAVHGSRGALHTARRAVHDDRQDCPQPHDVAVRRLIGPLDLVFWG